MKKATFKRQKRMKRESRERIIRALLSIRRTGIGMTFTELLKWTRLSKPVLTERLKEMREKEEVAKELSQDGNKILYVPTDELLNSDYAKQLRFQQILIDDIFTKIEKILEDQSLSDENRLITLSRTLSSLTLYNYFRYIGLEDGREWLRRYFLSLNTKLFRLPKERIERLKDFLNEIYPEEISLFNRLKSEANLTDMK